MDPELRELLEEIAENQRQILALAERQNEILFQPTAVINGVIDAVNGGLGRKTGLGFERPGFAGGIARS